MGDAVGVPYEFKERDSFQCDDMVGWGTHLLPPGTWSDDSSMTLATMESIVRRGRIDTADIMGNFDAWLSRAEFTPYDDVFDVGNATYKAICRYQQGTEPELCGGTGERDNGNGALMRILPILLGMPGAEILTFDNGLIHTCEYEDTESYQVTEMFINDRKRLLDRLL